MKTIATLMTAAFLASVGSAAFAASTVAADWSLSKTFSQSSEGGEGSSEGSEKPKGEGGGGE